MKKSNPTTKAQILRSAFYLLLLLGICAIPFALAKRSFDGRTTSATPSKQTRTLSFVERVAYQRAIEDVYWRHRIWPRSSGEQSGPKPALEKIMSQAQLEAKVEEYLRNSELLAQYWHRPITPEQLQAEMDRMAKHTKQPEVLRELFVALGNDPFVVAECLARAALAERLVTQLYGIDQKIHGLIKRRAEGELAGGSVEGMKQMSGNYNVMEWIRTGDEPAAESNVAHPRRLSGLRNEDSAGGAPALQKQGAFDGIKMTSEQWQENLDKLAASFNNTNAVVTPLRGVGREMPIGPQFAGDVAPAFAELRPGRQARGYSDPDTQTHPRKDATQQYPKHTGRKANCAPGNHRGLLHHRGAGRIQGQNKSGHGHVAQGTDGRLSSATIRIDRYRTFPCDGG